jgi:hypothetical protein
MRQGRSIRYIPFMQFTLDSNHPWLMERVIYLTRAGSKSYGTDTPESDVDIRGIAIPPVEYFFGTQKHFEQAMQAEPDIVVYGLQKFIRMLTGCNPNALELLFTEPEDQIEVHPIAAKLIEKRDLFVTQLAARTFLGYAQSALISLHRSITFIDIKNQKRRDRVAKFGFDTKNAMHLVRILRMGKEILSGKGVVVRRPDAQELLGILNGDWPLEDIQTWASVAESEIESILKKSPLPAEPDKAAIEKLCIEMIQDSFAHDVSVPVMATGFGHADWTFGKGRLVSKKLSEVEEEQ